MGKQEDKGVAASSGGRSGGPSDPSPQAVSAAAAAPAANAERLADMMWAFRNVPSAEFRDQFPEYSRKTIEESRDYNVAVLDFFLDYADQCRAA